MILEWTIIGLNQYDLCHFFFNFTCLPLNLNVLRLFIFFMLISSIGLAQNNISEQLFAIHSEHKLLATYNELDQVELWDLNDGTFINLFEHPNTERILFTPNGNHLAVVSNDRLSIWSLNENRLVHSLQADNSLGDVLAISDDSQYLLYIYQNTCVVWSLAANATYQKRDVKWFNTIFAADFDSESNTVFMVTEEDELISWDIHSGKKKDRLELKQSSSYADFWFLYQDVLAQETYDAVYFYDLLTNQFMDSLVIEDDYKGIQNGSVVLSSEESDLTYNPRSEQINPTDLSPLGIQKNGDKIEVIESNTFETVYSLSLNQKRTPRIAPELILPNTEITDIKYGLLLKPEFDIHFSEDYSLLVLYDKYNLVVDFMIFDHYHQLLISSGNLNLKKQLPPDTDSKEIDWIRFHQSGDSAIISVFTDANERLDFNHIKNSIQHFKEKDYNDYDEQENWIVGPGATETDLWQLKRNSVSVIHDNGDTLWTSPNFESYEQEKMFLLNNSVILTAIPNDTVRKEQILYWYDFINERILFSSNAVQLTEQRLMQHDHHLRINYLHSAEAQKDSYVYINLATGSIKKSEDSILFSAFEKKMCDTLFNYKVPFSNIEKHEVSGFFDVHKLEKWKKQGKLKTEISDEFMAPYLTSSLEILDAPNYPNYIFHVKDNKVTYHSGSSTGLYVYANSFNTSFWNGDIEGAPKTVHLLLDATGDHLFYTEDGYYYGSPELVRLFSFKYQDKVYPYSQFDLQFNRPDVILERLGYASKDHIAMYRNAYQKRLSKIGTVNEKPNMDLPQVSILNKANISAEITEEHITLDVQFTSYESTLDHYNVWINNVPIYSTKGIDLSQQKLTQFDTTLLLQLNSGYNLIQIATTNSNGNESFKEVLRIRSRHEESTPNLHFIGIGVKDYQDSTMNLAYSDKDIRDMAEMLSKAKGYGTVHIDTFLNENVTTAILPKIRKRLEQTSIHDQVIFMYSGHGLLDQELNYYLSTHNVDFLYPQKQGLLYDDVNDLFDGIPARKKLILLDACHSGELDKDEVELTASSGNLKEKDFSKASLNSVIASTGNSFELMKELFADLRRGTGATVISSSSGKYYSYEDATHQNGIYTYALKEGLEGAADENNDQEISVSELKTYLYHRVSELTNGKQKPTTREENLEFDFRVY